MDINTYEIKQIKQINIELAGGCNLECPMCPQSGAGREKEFKKVMSFDLFKKIIDESIPFGLEFVSIAGSGEPTLSMHLAESVSYLHARNIKSLIYTNGIRLDLAFFEKLCESGLSVLKVSCQGWDRESYLHWMSIDAYDEMRAKLLAFKAILDSQGRFKTMLQTNHLIQDYSQLEYQKEMYLKNWVNYIGGYAEIWKAHNWSGLYSISAISRIGISGNKPLSDQPVKRSCGRPLSEVLEVRAGGLDGHSAAVVPCPNVLGRDSEAVLGHVDKSDVYSIFNGEKYKDLRKAHVEKDFDRIDYCKDCDHLISFPEALVWTNIPGRTYGESRVSGIPYVTA